MPQFDKITFFNQIFWLFVFFSGYYLLLLKVFLPKISSVVKARSKKLKQGTRGLISYKNEQELVSVIFNDSIEKTAILVKKTINDETFKADSILNFWCSELNKNDFSKSNIFIENFLYNQIVFSKKNKKNLDISS